MPRVGKVLVGSVVANAGTPGQLAQRKLQALRFAQDVECGRDDGPAKVAVMVRAFGELRMGHGHGGKISFFGRYLTLEVVAVNSAPRPAPRKRRRSPLVDGMLTTATSFFKWATSTLRPLRREGDPTMNVQFQPDRGTAERRLRFECVALVVKGGGALGAYQAGVYEALAAAGINPDWVAGVSIGAVN